MSEKIKSAVFISPIFVSEEKEFLFAKVPSELSKLHLRRGRITVLISVGQCSFDAQMEPDGKLGHWFIIPKGIVEKESLTPLKKVSFTMTALGEQPEPSLPNDFKNLLAGNTSALKTWGATTTLAKIDWVHWMESAKQEKTKRERAANAIDMLGKGKKRVCCFDPSGFYSKALSSPKEKS
ncbi:MAG TPA: YdeI/OmpD-associated family protein [Gammaproteobacteria bacterium]|nr:YdeI/OmpD-associated family protein [Xanthomonadales bacterium]MCB1594960.1 YdeI/OmpD-associated family protein [Xanthomonadales bacterium]HOP23212.1 YdeI/OmpD-associated family protein [Gammaproteobacteria bacterium]HPI95358.1 YdeI/OmpD-associated family protein [Gammaproteobacteria bacterium]HPQ86592.1 YdeI/OmpD-associated family protein [Gammaproteobacteria bacterium]